MSRAALAAGALSLGAWALFAALGPTLLGLDHRGLLDIQSAGDATALHKGFGSYPLRALAPIAAVSGLLALGAMRLLRNAPGAPPAAMAGPPPRARAALST
jgi:hypothetical protein